MKVNITAQRTARITRLFYDEGELVKAGDLIATLDTSDVEVKLKNAEAELRQAASNLSALEAEYERKEALYKEGLVSKQQFDDVQTRLRLAQAALEIAKAAREMAELQYGRSFIKSPVSGVVTDRPVSIGDTVLSGQKIATVVDPNRLYISVPVDEADVSRVAMGQKARITMDAYPGRTFKGKVKRISPVVTGARREARTFEVRVSIPEENDIILKPGMSADVEIITGRARSVLVVPAQTIIDRGTEQIVYVVDNGRARQRRVEVGLFNWNFAEIKAGLKEGEIVIFTPDVPGFREGIRVRIVNTS